MGKVTSGLTMSLDGFIAGPNDGPEHPLGEGGMRLFDWYSSGDTDFVAPSGDMTFKVSSQAAEMLHEAFSSIGAIVTGRRTFDITNGWGGTHPIGENIPSLVQQCLRAGLLDEVHVDVVPVLLGDGVRLFDHLGTEHIELERTGLIADPDVTHMTFRVVK